MGAVARRPTLRDEPHPDSQEIEEAVEEATPSIWSRVTWKGVAAAAGAFFVITALVITGTELLTGQSLDGSSRTTVTDVLKASGSSGTSDHVSPARQTPTTDPTGSTSVAPTTDPSTAPLERSDRRPDRGRAHPDAHRRALDQRDSEPRPRSPTPSATTTP